MAAIALVGTPRAWQEAGNLLSFVQQKAQMKFWSMVLRPRESAEVELIAAAETFDDAPLAGHLSECYTERRETPAGEAANHSGAAPKTVAGPKAAARRQRTPARDSALIAHAAEARGKAARALDSVEIANLQLPSMIEDARPHTVAVPVARVAPQANNDTYTFVQIPSASPVASAFVEKGTLSQLKMLRKSFGDGKLLRQKGRFPAGKIVTFPSS